MASPREFARRIRDLGRSVEENVDRELKRTALLANQVVILATPVDTGRARANWQVGLGGPEVGQLDELSPSGAEAIARNAGEIQQRRGSQDVYISNNLPYIGRLNEGSSAQAPAGFVEKAVQAAVSALRQARVVRR